MNMKRTIKTSCGPLEINPRGIEMSEVSVRTLFKFGVALKTLFGRKGPFAENFRETDKICNYIWCLIFEWAVESKQNIMGFRIRNPRKGTQEEKWQYGMGYLTLSESSEEFGIPLPMLGRRASISLATRADVRHLNTNFQLVEKWNFDSHLDAIALMYLSESRIAPQWAIHNPYESFPNFIPIGYKCWPVPYQYSTDDRARGGRMAEWKHGRGEFGGDDSDSRAMDLFQWREATNVYHEECMLQESPDN